MAASNKQRIAGWILSGLVAAFFTFSAWGKFTDFPGKAEMFEHLGYSSGTMTGIGVLEVIVTILYVIPQTAFLGAILLTAYLGGAVSTHLRGGVVYLFPIIIGVIVWLGYTLRRPEVIKSAFGRG